MKKSKKFKIIIASLLLVSLSGNIFAATVSDNDGSAFISKSEFDSLKANFQAQIDNYNTSIDGKIDAAIAAYLAGIKISAQSIKPIIFQDAAEYGVISIDSKNPLDYCYGIPRLQNDQSQSRFKTNAQVYTGGSTTGLVMTRKWKQPEKPKPNTRSRHFATKSVITKLVQDETTKTNSIAQWEGYRKECDDLVKSMNTVRDTTWDTSSNTAQNGLTLSSNAYVVLETINTHTNTNLIGKAWYTTRDKQISGSTYTSINMSTTETFYVKSITHDWGTNVYPFVSVLQNYNYDMFSNKDRDYNLNYDGTYMRYFQPDTVSERYDNQAVYKWTAYGGLTASQNVGNPYRLGYNGSSDVKCAWYSISASTNRYQTGNMGFVWGRLWNNTDGAKTLNYRVPMLGFERTYLQSWKQIYLAGTEGIATFEKAKKRTAADSVLTSPKDSSAVYLGLTAGFPIIKLDKYEKLKFDAIFKDTNKDYVVWVSNKPFSSTGHPDDDTNCLELKGLTKASNTSRGYLVKNGSGTFETPKYKDAGYVYLKWGIYNDTKANIGGGILKPTGYATVTHEPE